MTVPANLTLESAPYGAQPVVMFVGPQGGPYQSPLPNNFPLLSSASRTGTTTSAQITNLSNRGIYVVFNVTANPGGAQTLQLEVQGVDPGTGQVWDLLNVVASATPGGVYCIYPGLSGGAVDGVALTRNLPLPQIYQVKVTHSGAGAWTYSVDILTLP